MSDIDTSPEAVARLIKDLNREQQLEDCRFGYGAEVIKGNAAATITALTNRVETAERGLKEQCDTCEYRMIGDSDRRTIAALRAENERLRNTAQQALDAFDRCSSADDNDGSRYGNAAGGLRAALASTEAAP